MKLNMDKVQFEYRSEVNNIATALQEWLNKNPRDDKAEDVRELIDKLEVLYMSW